MDLIELLKAVLFGIVQGITEWVPISSTGHMILLNEFVKLHVSAQFWEMFIVVIQLGSILAVVILYWKKLMPLHVEQHRLRVKKNTLIMWCKIAIACIPAALAELLFGDKINALFYNYQTIATMLLVFGVLFILVERRMKHKQPRVHTIDCIPWQSAFFIGVFQLVAAVLPGTSRSGATIIGALLLGLSRTTAAEFTFFLAVPAMAGASLLNILEFGLHFSASEATILLTGMLVSLFVSLFVMKFLVSYIKKHDFTPFGWYRIALGIAVFAYFGYQALR